MDYIYQFVKDKISLIQLFDIANSKNIEVATEKQLKDALNNKFMLSILAEQNNVKIDILKFKLRVILEKLRTEK